MKKYHDSLIKSLKDPIEAAEYLNAVLENDDKDMFLVALRNVAEAHGGLSVLARELKLNRANLYKIFSKSGNPEKNTLTNILKRLGLRLAVKPINKYKVA